MSNIDADQQRIETCQAWRHADDSRFQAPVTRDKEHGIGRLRGIPVKSVCRIGSIPESSLRRKMEIEKYNDCTHKVWNLSHLAITPLIPPLINAAIFTRICGRARKPPGQAR